MKMRPLSMLMRLATEDLRRITMAPSIFYEHPWKYYRQAAALPWSHTQPELLQLPKIGKDGYKVALDVSDFEPSDLSVKVVDNAVVIEGKLEELEKGDHAITRHLVQRFVLPAGYEAEQAVPRLSEDGVLTITVPNPPGLEAAEQAERTLPIQQEKPKPALAEKAAAGATAEGN